MRGRYGFSIASLEFALAQRKDQSMKRSRFSEEQIIGILKEHEAGVSVADLCRKHGVGETARPSSARKCLLIANSTACRLFVIVPILVQSSTNEESTNKLLVP